MRSYCVTSPFLGIGLMLCMILAGTTVGAGEPQTWRQSSEQGKLVVELTASDGAISLGEFHTWVLLIADAESSEGVAPVRVVVGGGMPAHGHGLPTQPQVTAHLGEGRYQVEGLMFNMAGQWQLSFDINTGSITDRVVFDLKIEH